MRSLGVTTVILYSGAAGAFGGRPGRRTGAAFSLSSCTGSSLTTTFPVLEAFGLAGAFFVRLAWIPLCYVRQIDKTVYLLQYLYSW